MQTENSCIMEEDFKITGFFYEQNGYKFRKYLNIVKNNSGIQTPDLMVIMMNPGSSRPVNGIDNYNYETETIPDNTQNQIMELMNNCNFKYGRILNLSDYRESKSKEFYKCILEFQKNNIHHSIFCNQRSKEFNKLFEKDIPVVLAWGVSYKLTNLAKTAIEKICGHNIVGYKKEGLKYAYYHPLPRKRTKQIEWLNEVTEIIKAQSKIRPGFV